MGQLEVRNPAQPTRSEQPDNHWLDCLVGCAVAASMQGTLLFGPIGHLRRSESE